MTVLDDIVAGVRQDVKFREQLTPFMDLVDHIPEMPPALPVLDRLEAPGVALIAEVKRATPASGLLAEVPDVGDLAQQFQAGGASIVSVLTEERRYQGSLTDLNAVRRSVTVPVLRKDFIVNPYQIYESRAYGADMLVLIVAALPGSQLISFLEITEQLGMTALVEVYDADELRWALQAGAQVIGINARNLKTMEINRNLFAELAPLLPDNIIRVAKSGVRDLADYNDYVAAGADAIIVAEALMRTADPRTLTAEMVAAGMTTNLATY